MTSLEPAQPVIAVIVNRYSDYRKPVIDHIAARLAQAGYGLLCVAGRELQAVASTDTDGRVIDSGIYALAATYDVRGYILMTVNLSQEGPFSVVQALTQRFSHKPAVSLGMKVPGMPSLVINNDACMRMLMRHMTRDSNHRRFVFLRGDTAMPDSSIRERVFREVLKQRGVPVDESLIIEGQFETTSAYIAMDQLLCKTHQIDAVVAASDIMAVSAIHALMKHGLRVPEDVIVSGFDNRPEATASSPPLTTVSHRFLDRANVAVDHLLQLIDQQAPGYATGCLITTPRSIDGELLIRESSESAEDRQHHRLETRSGVFDPELFRDYLLASLATVPPPEGLELESVVADLLDMLVLGSAQCELKLQYILQCAHTNPDDIRWWKHLSHQIGAALLKHGNFGQSSQALPLLASLQNMIQSTVWSVQEKDRFGTHRYLQMQDALHIQLTSSTDLVQVCAALRPALLQMGVRRAYLALYQTPGQRPDTCAHLALSLTDTRTTVANTGTFATRSVLPAGLLKTLSAGLLVQTPLCTGDTHFGYLLIDPANVERLNIDNLAHSISNAVCHCNRLGFLQRQAEALSNSNQKLSKLANYDPLTGLLNRARLRQILDRLFSIASRTGNGIALLFFDMDGFKWVNDTLGHSAGDELLILVTDRLCRVLGPGDSAARLGGDEFIVVIDAVGSPEQPVAVADRLLATLREPFSLCGRAIELTASIGIALYPNDGIDAETLLKHADTAMYKAKALGKNRYCHYTPDLNHAVVARLQMDQSMRSGLSKGEFSLHFQPRVDLLNGRLIAFEALMRWAPSDLTIVTPADSADTFIRLAEQTGFILELDSFALDAACHQARCWQDMGMPVRVAVNMSVKQLQRDGIVARVANTIASHRLDPACIELELTESAVMTDVQNNIVKLSALRQLGIQISIDDFGTGYSSLNYLKQLPVTSLKIDRSFMRDLQNDTDERSADAAIVQAVVALGKSMGFRLIAEGVENSVQRKFVARLGCDEAQGFFYAHALDVHAATRYLEQSCALEPA